MESVIVRVWLPDRPGALGQVATAIGAVGGEIVGIDILERGGGRAVDELAVDVGAPGDVPALVAAIQGVEGTDVEEVRAVDGGAHDPRSDALETAAILVGARTRADLVSALAEHGRRLLGGEWLAVIRLEGGDVVAADGPVPTPGWLSAFVEGSRSSARVATGETGPDDVVWAPVPGAGMAVVIGRDGLPFRRRERRQVAALARIVDSRLRDLARSDHPSSARQGHS